MPLRSDPLDELVIPDGTTVEEHDLVTDGDVIVGGQTTVEFGVRGHNVVAGERVRFGGDIEAEGDCRLDMWGDVAGNVLVGRDAYLGERVHVAGQLMVSGDLDIGDDVDIEEGFEANGWIVIRNPMPTIVFLFVYLSHLLRIGEEEAAEDVMAEFLDENEAGADPVLVPRNSSVSDDAWRVSTPATIGDDCRLHGNVRAESLTVGRDNTVFGSLRAREDLTVGSGTQIHGDVTTRSGTVEITAEAHVRGDVSAEHVRLHEDAVVEGSIRARGEMTMIRDTDSDDEAGDTADADETTADDDLDAVEQSSDDADDDTSEEADASDADEAVADEETRVDEEDAAESDDDTDADATAEATAGGDADDTAAAAGETTPTAGQDSDAVESGTERVTADGTDPAVTDQHRENGNRDDATELVE